MIGKDHERYTVPDLIEPVIGYRAWAILSTGNPKRLGLRSTFSGTIWIKGAVHAKCRTESWVTWQNQDKEEHSAPGSKCQCGVYAWYIPQSLGNPKETRPLVWGAIAAEGVIEVHNTGFRCEKAKIVTICMPSFHYTQPSTASLDEISGNLGLPVVKLESLQKEAHKYGAPIPENLRPKPDLFDQAKLLCKESTNETR